MGPPGRIFFICHRIRLILIAIIYNPPNGITGKYKAIVYAQNSEISVSADRGFVEMKKHETPSKRRRVGTVVECDCVRLDLMLLSH